MSPEQIAVIDAYAPRFRETTAGMAYIRRGVFWSELLAFAALADAAGARCIVESGTGLGFSASVLAQLFPHVTTIGLEDKPDGLPDNVQFVQADAWESMWEWCGGKEYAVLIDGPKHNAAVHLACERLEAKDCCLIGIHDLSHDSPAREMASMIFDGIVYTDSLAYVKAYGHMDAECLAMAGKRGKKFPAHGPTMGIIRASS